MSKKLSAMSLQIRLFFWMSTLICCPVIAVWSPDFMIIGAHKSGTTALYRSLINHPQVKSPKTKELNFFNDAAKFNKGISQYRTYFPVNLKDCEFTGEASTSYLYHPLVPKRVNEYYPDMKFIVLLRNPVDRAYSHYHYLLKCNEVNGLKETKLTFEETLEREFFRMAEEKEKTQQDPLHASPVNLNLSHITRGIYVEQLRRWFTYFPRNQFLILFFDDYKQHNQGTVNRVYAFLGLPKHEVRNVPNKRTEYGPMNPSTREMLSKFYAPYNKELEELLGIKLNWD